MPILCSRCARLPRQNRAEPDAKSRDFRSNPAQFRAEAARKQPQITFENCNDAAYHLQHIQKHFSVRGALAARVQRAKTLQNPTRSRAIFVPNFLNFSRGTQRTFQISNKIYCTRQTTAVNNDCRCFAADARVCRAKIAPNRTQNRAISDRNRFNFPPKMRADRRMGHILKLR